jgi:hypothetical protein
MHRSHRAAAHLSLAVFASAALLVAGATRPAAAGSGSRKACKLLKPAQIEKVLGAPAAKSDLEGTQVAGAESCSFDVGPGLGEPGGAHVVGTYYAGPIARGIGADIKTRAEPLSKGAVWDPLISGAYVVKPKKIVGVSVSYTSSDPPADELQDEMAKLAKAGSKRA